MSRNRSLAAALLIAAVNLRLTVAAVPPVLNQIRHTTGLSSAGAGLLTGVPVFCFGLVALASPRLIRRFSMGPLLSLTLLAVLGGCLVRLVPDVFPLFLGTVLLGSGIAVGNVLIPGLIKRDFAQRRVMMTALYSVALSGGGAVAAGLTVPIEHATGLGWRVTISLWGVLAVLAVLLWTPHVRDEVTLVDDAHGRAIPGLWRDRLAWCVSGFMGLQSFGFYATLSWLPTIAEDHGASESYAGLLVSLAAFCGMIGAFSMPSVERRVGHRSVPVAICFAACAAGYTGLLVAPGSAIIVWCVVFGYGQGALLALALGYIVARSPDSQHAARLSTMAQSVGYLIASAAPFAMGALHGATGSWTLPVVMLLVSLVPMLLTGLVACQQRYVLAKP
ncbi:MAG TPA: MFS transporter [Solirubrobacteraceae bacterium]|jgi:CP family cyanate transporter-like MFS transporter|nr:MFS transporter [Solirubrobacteraceae bacterium]